MEDRDRLGQRNRQVEEQRALPGLPGGFDPQLVPALGGGVRLGGQQPGVDVRGFPAVARRPAQRGAVRGFALRRTAGHTLRARPPGRAPSPAPSRPGPTSGRAAPRRSRWPGCNTWPRPWPGRGPPASRCTPGHSPCSGSRQPPPANPPPAAAAELPMIIRWCMGVKLGLIMLSRVTKRPIKIRNEKRLNGHNGMRCTLSFANESEPLPACLSHLRVSAIEVEPPCVTRHAACDGRGRRSRVPAVLMQALGDLTATDFVAAGSPDGRAWIAALPALSGHLAASGTSPSPANGSGTATTRSSCPSPRAAGRSRSS